jgi:adhesin transport system outer membrane protein
MAFCLTSRAVFVGCAVFSHSALTDAVQSSLWQYQKKASSVVAAVKRVFLLGLKARRSLVGGVLAGMHLGCLRLAITATCAVMGVGYTQAETTQGLFTSSEGSPPRVLAGPERISLEDLIGLAVQSHPDIVAKRAELDSAKAGQWVARWQYFPTPSLQLRNSDNGDQVAVVALQQPLWTAGRLDAGLDAAEARSRLAELAIVEAQYTVALRLTASWQSLMQAHGRSLALGRGLSLLEVYAQRVRNRISGGISAEVDSELVQLRLAQLRGELASARAAERSALFQLSQWIGRPVHAEKLLARTGDEAAFPDFETLIDESVRYSAGLQRLAAELEAAKHDASQKRAALWPTLALRAEHQQNLLSNGKSLQDNRLMLFLDYVPGAGLSAAAGIASAVARVASLGESRESALRELLSKVAADYEEFVSGLSRRQDMLRTSQAASEVLASYDRLFIAGKRNWLDVLNAAREHMQVEISLADNDALLGAASQRIRLHGGHFAWQRRGM